MKKNICIIDYGIGNIRAFQNILYRKNIDYKKSNSAKKKFGGGLLLELSHEIDYIKWLFGNISLI